MPTFVTPISGRNAVKLVSLAIAIAFAFVALSDSATAYPRHPVVNTAALNINGGGAYLTNKAAGYYMGRLYDGQIFQRRSVGGRTHPQTGAYVDSWGHSEAHNRCFWLGPQGGGPYTPYLGASIGNGSANGCTDSLRTSLGNRLTIGKDFNCVDGDATGGSRTKLIGTTPFYYTLLWSSNYQSLSATGQQSIATLHPGHVVSYRYTTKDNQWAAVEVMAGDGDNAQSLGWGFIQRASLSLPSGGVFNYYNDPTAQNRVCDRVGSTPGTLIPEPDTFVTEPFTNGNVYYESSATFTFNAYAAGVFTGWNKPVTVNIQVAKTECKLDDGAWHVCSSPYNTGTLAKGHHTFQVRTHDTATRVDTTPSVRSFTVRSAAHFADVTGDGKADAIAVDKSGTPGISVRRSTGTGFGSDEVWTAGSFKGDRGTEFADVTGDGMADAIAVNNSGVFVRASTGNAFTATNPEDWTGGAYFGSRLTEFADVTGDGKADAIVVNDNGVTVRRSTGSSFSANETWTSGAFYGDKGTYFADVTGDDKADAIVVNSSGATGITVRPSNGTSFGPNQSWTNTISHGTHATAFADTTGDGRADALTSDAGGGLGVRRADTASFGVRENWSSGDYFGNKGTYFADTTGDGRADAIVVNSGTTADGIHVKVSADESFGPPENWASGTVHGDLLTEMADVNQDARADLVMINSSGPNEGVSVRLASSTGLGSPSEWLSEPVSGEIKTMLADVTDDERADLISIDGSEITYLESQGDEFDEDVREWFRDPFYGTIDTFFADVDGDERNDAIALNATGINVVEGEGRRGNDEYDQWLTGASAGSIATFFADMTGDQRADQISINSTGVVVRRSNGNTFGAAENWLATTMASQARYYIADTNNDAVSDLVIVGEGSSPSATVYLGSPTGFTPPSVWLSAVQLGSLKTFVTDLDGDGRADVLAIGDENGLGALAQRQKGARFEASSLWGTGSFFGV